jgi:hypothetical protein
VSVPVRAGGGVRVSARPERLVSLGETTIAIREALTERAGYLADACDLYESRHGVDWRADVDALPGALTAWAEALSGLGEWTGLVGQAYLEADGDDAGGVHRLSQARLWRLLPAEARPALDTAIAGAPGGGARDWGEPGDPPGWLAALQATDVAVGHTAQGVDTATVFVRGQGAAATWHESAPALLGRFVEPEVVTRLDRAFGVADAGLTGALAMRDQVEADRRSLAYSPGEVTARAVARGGGEAGLTVLAGASSVAAAGVVSPWCGPAAPVCAGAAVVGVGWAVSQVGGAGLDGLLRSPRPAEHDPEVVRDEVLGPEPRFLRRDLPHSQWGGLEQLAGVPPPELPEPVRDGVGPEPGYRPRDIPGATWDVIEAAHDAGRAVAAPPAGASS